jgi:hydrogenase expression/formation protein HypD
VEYITEYRDAGRIAKLAKAVAAVNPGDRTYTFMEVCGTHTMAIGRHGLRQLLPENVRLVSGPGCPVCVTPKEYVDHAAALARAPGVTVATFGDMMRVPGSSASLATLRAEGADVRVVYSPRDALRVAREDGGRKVVFLAVGFETTAPTVAATVRAAAAAGDDNFLVLAAHKLIPPALRALCRAAGSNLDGFLCPAHVSAVIGADAYSFIADEFGLPCAVAGFEPVDILQGVYMLLRQHAEGGRRVDNGYSRVVKAAGNEAAQAAIADAFEPCDSSWRGIGAIPASGLRLRDGLARFDAAREIAITPEPTTPDHGCACGAILTGAKTPAECALFGERCTPETPVGPCMVSSEGTCAAAYKYGV